MSGIVADLAGGWVGGCRELRSAGGADDEVEGISGGHFEGIVVV